MAGLKRALPDAIFPGEDLSFGKIRLVLADWDYEGDRGWVSEAGLAWTRRHLARTSEPVLVCGFDGADHLARRKEGALLNAKGVAYLRLPARIEELRAAAKALIHSRGTSLSEESLLQNISDFQAALRSDFWHGPLRSLRGNLNGILTSLKDRQYRRAVDQMKTLLDRVEKAKLSIRRLKNQFPTGQPPFNILSGMEAEVNGMETPAAQAMILLKSDPQNVEPFLFQIDQLIKSLEKKVDDAAPKNRKER